jgi:hypothetical protein
MFIAMNSKVWFNREKVFLFFALIQQIWKKKFSYSRCEIDGKNLLSEVESLFFNSSISWKK